MGCCACGTHAGALEGWGGDVWGVFTFVLMGVAVCDF